MDITKFEDMLNAGQDNALVRFTMGNAFFQHKKFDQAIEHLQKAVEMDSNYSAAWKLYGRCLLELHRLEEAVDIYEKGLEVARTQGDMQAVREMEVFLNRLRKDIENIQN